MKETLTDLLFLSVTQNLRYNIHKRGVYTHEIVLSNLKKDKKR